MSQSKKLFQPKVISGYSRQGSAARKRRKPPRQVARPLTIDQILAWADIHRDRTGKWPKHDSGRVYLAPFETWSGLNTALAKGQRGLPGGSSLVRLLAEHRGTRNALALPPLSIEQILAWADAHRERTGKWPRRRSGRIHKEPFETWSTVNLALCEGRRGLPEGFSLATLLWKHRGVRRPGALPPLSVKQILNWADAHHRQTGEWPNVNSGPIEGTSGETWIGVSEALREGHRGLRGRSSLAKLLAKHRGVRNRQALPPLSVEQILAWADAHRERTGLWPKRTSGPVQDAPGETWNGIQVALWVGVRGLPGGTSLSRLLETHRNVPKRLHFPPLTIDAILAWADERHQRTGEWPGRWSGPIEGETVAWLSIDKALEGGHRGLPGGSSLAKLLAEHRGRRNPAALPPLSVEQILVWADEHHRETGTWPTGDSGPVKGEAEETWRRIETALRQGWRGFPGGSSLAKLLAEHHARHRDTADLPCLTVRRILAWADAHHERSGRWPNEQSGLVYHAPGETWAGINAALHAGTRGLRGGSSLRELLAKQRGVPRRLRSPPLTTAQILTWADRHHDRTGDWPRVQSGIADKESGLTWAAIDIALQRGLRGLPGASSLHKLLVQERGVPRKPGSLR